MERALLDLRPAGHRLLGGADPGQHTLAELVSWTFSNFAYPESYPADENEFAKYTASEQRGEGWRLLVAQHPTNFADGNTTFNWGIAGARFIVIPEVDVPSRRFDRALAVESPY